MREVVFIIGGCKSGKSSFALQLSEENYPGLTKHYMATAIVFDQEMEERVKRHREDRKDNWFTIECPYELPSQISKIMSKHNLLLVDCLTMWINNLLFKGLSTKDIEKEIKRLVDVVVHGEGVFVFVSNEVGLGIVPGDKLSRQFRDIVGILHQKIAEIADKVYFVTCGIPNLIKQGISE